MAKWGQNDAKPNRGPEVLVYSSFYQSGFFKVPFFVHFHHFTLAAQARAPDFDEFLLRKGPELVDFSSFYNRNEWFLDVSCGSCGSHDVFLRFLAKMAKSF